jgi:hypothetical protein
VSLRKIYVFNLTEAINLNINKMCGETKANSIINWNRFSFLSSFVYRLALQFFLRATFTNLSGDFTQRLLNQRPVKGVIYELI